MGDRQAGRARYGRGGKEEVGTQKNVQREKREGVVAERWASRTGRGVIERHVYEGKSGRGRRWTNGHRESQWKLDEIAFVVCCRLLARLFSDGG